MTYRKSTDSFLSSDGKTAVACYFYEPADCDPIGIVQLSHGMCEYVERYEDFASYLCGKGFLVCGNDHLGHGRTAASPEELGFFADSGGAAFLVEDVYRMTALVKRHYSSLPLVLFGHSMGSFIARAYLEKYGSELQGAVICGTSGGNPMAGLGILLSGRIIAQNGLRHRSPFMKKLALGSYNSRIDSPKSTNAWISRDIDIVSKYDADPLCNFSFTASAYRDLFTLLKQISAPSWAAGIKKDLPLLLIAGEADPVGDYGLGVRKVASRLIEAGVQDVTLRLYPECRHEIINELNRGEVYDGIFSWIRSRTHSRPCRCD